MSRRETNVISLTKNNYSIMFFEIAKQGKNGLGLYIASIFIIFLAWQILGGFVFLGGIMAGLPEGKDMMEAMQAMNEDLNFEKLGIDANYGLFFMIIVA